MRSNLNARGFAATPTAPQTTEERTAERSAERPQGQATGTAPRTTAPPAARTAHCCQNSNVNTQKPKPKKSNNYKYGPCKEREAGTFHRPCECVAYASKPTLAYASKPPPPRAARHLGARTSRPCRAPALPPPMRARRSHTILPASLTRTHSAGGLGARSTFVRAVPRGSSSALSTSRAAGGRGARGRSGCLSPNARAHFLRAACSIGVRYSAQRSASTAMSIVAMPSGAPGAPERMCAVARSLSVM